MFSWLKKIKDKIYLQYIDKVVNSPEAIEKAIQESLIIEDILNSRMVDDVVEAKSDPKIEESISSLEEITAVEDLPIDEQKDIVEPKKKPGRPKSSSNSVAKKPSAKKPAVKKD